MNTPSGYTALDLIGFTDRGAYDSTANYVKNDLTHDLSNKIWRCLIDDTHGVAPAEGVNWTLFIDSQTALSGMSDVQITTPATGEALVYDGTASKWKNEQLADVALSGDYDDLINLPTLGTAAAKDSTNAVTQGSTDLIEAGAVYSALADKANTADLATVATSGAYSDLSGTPSLATVATSGSYNDLLNKPTLGTAAAKDSTNAVTQNSTDLVESGAVYTEVNSVKETLTNNINLNGCKNLLPIYLPLGTTGGITFTKDANGDYVLNGTSTGTPLKLSLLDSTFVDDSNAKIVAPSVLGIDTSKTYVFSRVAKVSEFRYYLALYNGSTLVTTIALNNDAGLNVEIDFSQYTVNGVKAYIAIGNGTVLSNAKMQPMLCLKTDYDLDPTYEPWTKTNRQLTQETTGLIDNTVVNGAVNSLENTKSTYVESPVTWTVNADKTVTAAVASTVSTINIFLMVSASAIPHLKNGETYRLTGCPSGGSDSLYEIYVVDTTAGGYVARDYGNGAEFTYNSSHTYNVGIVMRAGLTARTLLFKPMISPASMNLTYNDYVPYAKSNGELTSDKTETVVITSKIEDGSTAVNNINNGEYVLRKGKLKKSTASRATGEAIGDGNFDDVNIVDGKMYRLASSMSWTGSNVTKSFTIPVGLSCPIIIYGGRKGKGFAILLFPASTEFSIILNEGNNVTNVSWSISGATGTLELTFATTYGSSFTYTVMY